MCQYLSIANWLHCANQLESTVSLHQSLQLLLGVATYPLTKDKPSNGFPHQVLGRPGEPIPGVSSQCNRCSPPMGLYNQCSLQRDKGSTPHLCNVSQSLLRPCQAVQHAQDLFHVESPRRDSERLALELNYKSTRV